MVRSLVIAVQQSISLLFTVWILAMQFEDSDVSTALMYVLVYVPVVFLIVVINVLFVGLLRLDKANLWKGLLICVITPLFVLLYALFLQEVFSLFEVWLSAMLFVHNVCWFRYYKAKIA